jgi:coenzyme F420-dependent glucose-6-phosphate dehydrogenase
MVEIGYALSSEEHSADELVELAAAAESAGFSFAFISDHYHPWTDRQGQSPFVWTVLGAIAAKTSRIRLGTGVTCPIIRIHPAVIAQAAATTAALMPGRFWLGLGTGERLNEHVVGRPWPPVEVRRAMLEEAVSIIRGLWQGGTFSHRGAHFTVEDARIYSLPRQLPLILLAAAGPVTGTTAGRIADGLISTAPSEKTVTAYRQAAPDPGPRIGQLTVCWAPTEREARQTALTWWPTAALHGAVSQELARPADFADLAKGVTADQVADEVICGPDPEPVLEAIRAFEAAGFDHVYLHQVGREQEGFLRFAQDHLLRQPAGARA